MRRTLFIGHITLFGTCLHADAWFLQLCNFALLQGEALSQISLRGDSHGSDTALFRWKGSGSSVHVKDIIAQVSYDDERKVVEVQFLSEDVVEVVVVEECLICGDFFNG
uniref:Uncharacterized protein n=1 Tax=Chaetoceros debilis TaxID=122233 RepID=A0A6S8XNU9_9STRA|mmetsp:Transcript_17429/g.26350  ORF Transcript_17429/g.26350 Transcript_17429/m.26350 type:complete len:109 (+) Transcript_17429:621-947(+)